MKHLHTIQIYLHKLKLKHILPFFVATLILINGLINIILALLANIKSESINLQTLESTQQYGFLTMHQASSIFTIVIGIFLIYVAIGLYKKRKIAWWLAIVFLCFLSIEHAFPKLVWLPLILALLSLCVLILFKHYFNTRGAGLKTQAAIAWSSVILALAYGSIGSYLLRSQFEGIHSFIDALYFTVITYSTIGYGDITPITQDARLFVLTMVFIGLGSFATIISVLLAPLVERKLKRVLSMVENINHLKKHAILAGVNHTTLQIAKALKSKGVYSLFIGHEDSSIDLEAEGFKLLPGNATDMSLLKKATLSQANYLYCGHENDAENILIALSVSAFFEGKAHKPKVIVKIERPDNIENAKRSGADEIIVPALLSSHHVLTLLA